MKLSNQNTINLEDFRTLGAKVYTGRDRGKKVREDSNIDIIESQNDEVNIIIPNNVYSIIPSFFEELFFNAVVKLGKDRFLHKFKFTSEGNYKYEKPLYQAIERILREEKTSIG